MKTSTLCVLQNKWPMLELLKTFVRHQKTSVDRRVFSWFHLTCPHVICIHFKAVCVLKPVWTCHVFNPWSWKSLWKFQFLKSCDDSLVSHFPVFFGFFDIWLGQNDLRSFCLVSAVCQQPNWKVDLCFLPSRCFVDWKQTDKPQEFIIADMWFYHDFKSY